MVRRGRLVPLDQPQRLIHRVHHLDGAGTSLRFCPNSRHQHPLTSFDVLTQRVRPHVARLTGSALCEMRVLGRRWLAGH